MEQKKCKLFQKKKREQVNHYKYMGNDIAQYWIHYNNMNKFFGFIGTFLLLCSCVLDKHFGTLCIMQLFDRSGSGVCIVIFIVINFFFWVIKM